MSQAGSNFSSSGGLAPLSNIAAKSAASAAANGRRRTAARGGRAEQELQPYEPCEPRQNEADPNQANLKRTRVRPILIRWRRSGGLAPLSNTAAKSAASAAANRRRRRPLSPDCGAEGKCAGLKGG
jgi:hypothetical protein